MSSNFLLHNYLWQISLDKRLLYISFVTYREMIQIYWTNAEKISWTFLSQLETKTAKVWQPRKSGLRSIPFCLKVVVWFQFYWKKIKNYFMTKYYHTNNNAIIFLLYKSKYSNSSNSFNYCQRHQLSLVKN